MEREEVEAVLEWIWILEDFSKVWKEEARMGKSYPTDKEGNEYKNSWGRKKRLKGNVRKANRVALAIRSWWSTQEFSVNEPAYEPFEEDFWRDFCNIVRNGTPWHLAARVMWAEEDRVWYWIEHDAHYIDKEEVGDETMARKVIVKDEILKEEAKMEQSARDAINASISRWNVKSSMEYLDRIKEREKRFHDRAEYRQIAKDYGMSEKEYVWCLNVLNGITQQKASEMAWRPKNLNMYHYRMNPKVKEFIAVVKAQRRNEIIESIPFNKETAQKAMSYVMGTLLDELEKGDNSKGDVLKITKEIRDTATEMWKATNMYPKEEEKIWTTNIAILAGENTDAVLQLLWRKHRTEALNLTEFANDGQNRKESRGNIEVHGWAEGEMTEWGAVEGVKE